MEIYDRVANIVAPKKAALTQSEGELAAIKRAELKVVIEELDTLKQQLQDCASKKADLES